MLTPDQLDALPRRFVQLWQQVEDDILQDIARRMKSLGELDPLTPTAIWQAWRLAETRAVRSNTVATLAKYTGKSRAEIKRLLETAGVQTLAADDAVYTAAGLDPPPVNQSPALLNLLNAGYCQTRKHSGTASGSGSMITFSRRSKMVFAKHLESTLPVPKPNPGGPTSRRDFWMVWPASGRTSPAGCVTSSRIL